MKTRYSRSSFYCTENYLRTLIADNLLRYNIFHTNNLKFFFNQIVENFGIIYVKLVFRPANPPSPRKIFAVQNLRLEISLLITICIYILLNLYHISVKNIKWVIKDKTWRIAGSKRGTARARDQTENPIL